MSGMAVFGHQHLDSEEEAFTLRIFSNYHGLKKKYSVATVVCFVNEHFKFDFAFGELSNSKLTTRNEDVSKTCFPLFTGI